MRIVRIVVPGKPYAKKRPRFARATGRAYDPAENGVAEASIGHLAATHFRQPVIGAIRIKVVATFAIPKSWSKKKRAEHLGQPHTQKPDGDNILKAAKDALNRIAWADDGQVFDARCIKMWGEVEQTEIIVGFD